VSAYGLGAIYTSVIPAQRSDTKVNNTQNIPIPSLQLGHEEEYREGDVQAVAAVHCVASLQGLPPEKNQGILSFRMPMTVSGVWRP